VVAPPSRHHTGRAYRFLPGRDLDAPLAQVPEVLLARLRHRHADRPAAPVVPLPPGEGPGHPYAWAALATELGRVAGARVGERNRRLWEAARNLYNLVATRALPEPQVHQGLLAAAERCGLLAEEPRQTRRTLASARQVGLAHPRSLPTRLPPALAAAPAPSTNPTRPQRRAWRPDPERR
jgi:putative DNA primase/helicase